MVDSLLGQKRARLVVVAAAVVAAAAVELEQIYCRVVWDAWF